MKRREVVTLLGGAAAWPLAARAQQPKQMRRIGVLMALDESEPEGKAQLLGFTQGLSELGWTVGTHEGEDKGACRRSHTQRHGSRSCGRHYSRCNALSNRQLKQTSQPRPTAYRPSHDSHLDVVDEVTNRGEFS
jgi:hypothetical protein